MTDTPDPPSDDASRDDQDGDDMTPSIDVEERSEYHVTSPTDTPDTDE